MTQQARKGEAVEKRRRKRRFDGFEHVQMCQINDTVCHSKQKSDTAKKPVKSRVFYMSVSVVSLFFQ